VGIQISSIVCDRNTYDHGKKEKDNANTRYNELNYIQPGELKIKNQKKINLNISSTGSFCYFQEKSINNA
jgi:hypothetical protein